MNFMDFLNDNRELIGAGLGAILGGLDGEGPVTTNRTNFLPGQEQGLTDYIDLALQEYDQGPRPFFPGDTVAGLDPNVIAGQNELLGIAPLQRQLGDMGAFAAGELASGGAGFVEGFDLPDQVGFGIPQDLQDATLSPVMSALNRRLNQINTTATAQGAFGGSRMGQQISGAFEDASEAGTEALTRANLAARGQSIQQRQGDITSMLEGRGQDIRQGQLYNQALASGVNALAGAAGALALPGQTQLDVGRQRTAYEQSLIDADRERFEFNRDEPMNALDLLGRRLTLTPGTGSTQASRTPANFASILGGAIAGSQLPGQIFGPRPAQQDDPLSVFGPGVTIEDIIAGNF